MIFQQLLDTSNFTFQEQAVVTYILENPEVILESTAKELAAKTYTSSATIVRLCKKLGFNGYPSFQLQFAKEYSKEKNEKKIILSKDSSNIEISHYVESLYHDVIFQTKEMINKDTLNRIINLLCHIKKIDFYASDINFPRVQIMCMKLNNLGIHAQAFNTLNESYISTLNPDKCISFIISHSGKNPTMIDIAYQLRKKNIKTIAITSKIAKNLELVCNESLYIYCSAIDFSGTIQYGISLEYVLDTIYLCLLLKKNKL